MSTTRTRNAANGSTARETRASGRRSPRFAKVQALPGRPLYLAVRDAVRAAIESGTFANGQRMPSTKELSEELNVSLVTMHRALRELVQSGVLRRSQGKGTIVHHRQDEPGRVSTRHRLGLIIHREVSIADYYHSQILDGIRNASDAGGIDLVLLRFGEDARNECDGYLLLNPIAGKGEMDGADLRKRPCMVVGARSNDPKVCSVDVDNIELARQATSHLIGLGHRRIAFVGGGDEISNSADRWTGFEAARNQSRIPPDQTPVIRSEGGWRLTERERLEMMRLLGAPDRPTAIFAAGYYFALDIYSISETAGLRISEDLSVIGVDDPPSAAYLSPALTTMRQPLTELGHAAVTALAEQVRQGPVRRSSSRLLMAELVIRRSTTPLG